MTRRQRQKAGAESSQIQVAGDLVVVGINEDRAKEIAREQADIAIKEFTAEANNLASDRIDDLDEKIVRELADRDLLASFSDPAFQVLLRRAQITAATTSDEDDHVMLAKLLAEKAELPSKPMQLVITRSVELIEYLDADALLGVTLLFFVTNLVPASPEPLPAFGELNRLASLVISDTWPTGMGWLRRLDVMDCVHYQVGAGQMHSWDLIMFQKRPGYVSEGIPEEDVSRVIGELRAIGPDLSALVVPHVFLPGRFRINTARSVELIANVHDVLTAEQIQRLEAVLNSVQVDVTSNDAIAAMGRAVESDFPALQAVRAWWDVLPKGIFELTPVGKAIAYSNLKRFDNLDGLDSLADIIAQ